MDPSQPQNQVDLGPLYQLRVRTPRLELRLATHHELCQLRDVAARGVHPAEQMPFSHPWTDEPYSESWVVAYFVHTLSLWTSENWRLDFTVWAEGQIAGTQGIGAEAFATSRTVSTGSWLGMAFQGRGYGTEMRAAVLDFAFRVLGADRALSDYLDGNRASARVSEKLGYSVIGHDIVSPRGTPVPRTHLELHRDQWSAPHPVRIEHLSPCLSLFGLSD